MPNQSFRCKPEQQQLLDKMDAEPSILYSHPRTDRTATMSPLFGYPYYSQKMGNMGGDLYLSSETDPKAMEARFDAMIAQMYKPKVAPIYVDSMPNIDPQGRKERRKGKSKDLRMKHQKKASKLLKGMMTRMVWP